MFFFINIYLNVVKHKISNNYYDEMNTKLSSKTIQLFLYIENKIMLSKSTQIIVDILLYFVFTIGFFLSSNDNNYHFCKKLCSFYKKLILIKIIKLLIIAIFGFL